jgi:hypothetical protein
MKPEFEGPGTAPKPGPKPGILELATRYFRPHAWAYGIALILEAILALISGGLWLFWPLMIWTILFLIHFLVVKSLNIDGAWVAARTEKTAMKAFDISHIETIREKYEKQYPGAARDAGEAMAEPDETSENRP